MNPYLARRVCGPQNLHAAPAALDRRWYNIATNLALDTSEIWIYDEIGYWGVTASDFVAELNALNTSKIDLHINSGGGEVFDGLAIYNAIKQHPAEITTHVDALAASAASFIAMAGATVLMAKNAELMIHDAIGLTVGNAADHAKMVDDLNRISDNIASIYADKAGGDTASWRSVMRDEKWYSATEAVASGLADGIQGATPAEEQPSDVADAPAFAGFDPELIRAALKEAFTRD